MKYHDLSAGIATIDYKILFDVVTNALALEKEEVYRLQNQINNDLMDNYQSKGDKNLTGAVMASERLIDASIRLNKALETYHVMKELEDRETLVIKKFNKEIISQYVE